MFSKTRASVPFIVKLSTDSVNRKNVKKLHHAEKRLKTETFLKTMFIVTVTRLWCKIFAWYYMFVRVFIRAAITKHEYEHRDSETMELLSSKVARDSRQYMLVRDRYNSCFLFRFQTFN